MSLTEDFFADDPLDRDPEMENCASLEAVGASATQAAWPSAPVREWRPFVGGYAWKDDDDGPVRVKVLHLHPRYRIGWVRDGESEYSVPLSLLRERRGDRDE